ncbi:helix-turn-helix transcriptional regulator [Leptothoe sp. PORK10 BA2]|uniref:helix-turn-helix transcriptional regulator n=1 Tax=Leptothoe sp. PORK10 BA2 TaxID=3110254 RepID=UPI002B1F0DC2|nr:helix-turn-helix transcriptional regulator [Leptothoe sp. PORK10 BA2]MEA5463414.1 helix-turn-helix transcriptional regulator [Leptothoe sp. PORK10 BA2]
MNSSSNSSYFGPFDPAESFDHGATINSLLATALDHLVDGLLIVSASGRILKANTMAVHVCHGLVSSNHASCELSQVPKALWTLCQPIFKNMTSGIETHLGLEMDIVDAQQQPIRVRIQPLNLKAYQEHCLMLILEDRQQAHRRRAVADGKRYGLTPREVKVWELRLQNQSYEAIASKLYITENTVKKHVKSILAKRRVVGDGGEYGAIAS